MPAGGRQGIAQGRPGGVGGAGRPGGVGGVGGVGGAGRPGGVGGVGGAGRPGGVGDRGQGIAHGNRGQGNRFNNQQRQNNWNQNRQNFNNWSQNNYYGGGWGGGYWGSGNWWGPVAWSGVAGFVGGMAGAAIGGAFHEEPTYYGGGGGEVYTGGDTIVVNGESHPVEEYAQEATSIADNYDTLTQDVATPPAAQPEAIEAAQPTSATAAPEVPPEPVPADVQAKVAADWMPLGIYAITDPNSTTDPTKYAQLVISKSGAVGGTMHDLASDTSTPIEGALDPKSQRVAFKVANADTVIETGLYNLTQSETPILIHEGGKTKQMTMARIEDPGAAQSGAAQQPATTAPQPSVPQQPAMSPR